MYVTLDTLWLLQIFKIVSNFVNIGSILVIESDTFRGWHFCGSDLLTHVSAGFHIRCLISMCSVSLRSLPCVPLSGVDWFASARCLGSMGEIQDHFKWNPQPERFLGRSLGWYELGLQTQSVSVWFQFIRELFPLFCWTPSWFCFLGFFCFCIFFSAWGK